MNLRQRVLWVTSLPKVTSRCQRPEPQGFTLVELLTATIIMSLVLSLVGFGVITTTKASQKTESVAARRHDLSRAFDFISNEIRMAHRINQTNRVVATNSSTLVNVVTDSGLNLSDLGNYGTLVLYLEIPISSQVPTVCPAGGPNAGSPPPQPANYDRVVYDIRASDQDWLPPNSIFRYGRIPRLDGSIDPCSNPMSSDTLVDAIANQSDGPPPCNPPGVLSGADGFQTCFQGMQVNLMLRSNISDVEIQRLTSTATSRVVNSQSVPELTGVKTSEADTVDLSWTWPGQSALTTFQVTQTIVGNGADETIARNETDGTNENIASNGTDGTNENIARRNETPVSNKTKVYSGSDLSVSLSLPGRSGEQHCYTVTATTGEATSPESTPICITK